VDDLVVIQQVPSYTMMGISRGDSAPALTFSPLGEACSRNDLTAVHEILVKTGYKDDEGTDNEVFWEPFPAPLIYFLWENVAEILIVVEVHLGIDLVQWDSEYSWEWMI
jgi:hypothetical protein